MIRGTGVAVKTLCASKNFTMDVYASSLHVSCWYTSTKPVSNQKLPKLPVPKLEDTLTKYLKTVRPHLNHKEYAVTSELVKEFGSNEGIGQKLQKLLEKRASSHSNWLEDWWLTTAYLEYRDTVVVNSSPGLVFPLRKFADKNEQLILASKTLSAALDYKSLVDNNQIPVDMMGKMPLDMTQYKKIFGTCRIPCEKRDKLSFNDSKYVTVIHNNHIFHVDLWDCNGKRLNEEEILQQLKVVKDQSREPACNPVGILTSEHRDEWAKAYSLLSKDNTNKASLEDIEKSLVVLCLDAPVNLWQNEDRDGRMNIAAAQTIHGGGTRSNGSNRWFDKTVQFIVGADGVHGLTYEHSPAEGQPIAVLTDFIINKIDHAKKDDSKTKSSARACLIPPTLLKWNVSDEVTNMMKKAENNLDKLAGDLELNCFKYDKYGKNFIKTHKMSPDSYLQMAMQLAFYRTHKVPGAHYESAATRMYEGGRTETIRSCSIESIEFAQAMLTSKCSPKEKVEAMRKAINAHKDYTVQALQGFGVDRHLLGLKLIALENGIEVPKLYSDPGYVKSSHMRISTSQVACKCDGFMCYGPLVGDGYATCYNPRSNDINFATSASRACCDTSCDSYRCGLEQSLQDMHDTLLLSTTSKL